MRFPLDIVETPFRDLTRSDARRGPPVHGEARARSCWWSSPSSSCSKWRHLLLHNQNALFVKRLFLFEPNVVLSSVPYVLGDREPEEVPAG